ncbi:class I adenylate-forming enzyme family protein [Streptomyces sp. HNM0574]|uniref:AMP-binding protein n=1 Tax=Streptomyces sp. HNM0574 TaxID=2714954 RepID=UPI00146AD5F9|nr:acyl--CoA ligase [Streptomyces sp. HNM0574]
MTAPWTSRAGVPFPDRVPRADRLAWAEHAPDQDLYALFTAHVRAHPHRQALVEAGPGTGTVLDYAALDREVRRVAGLFAEAGIGPGDVVALRMPNGADAVAAELAVYAVGAVALPYPPGGGSRDTLALLGGARARAAVLADPADAALRDRLPYLETVFTPHTGVPGTTWLGGSPRHPHPGTPSGVDPESPARILVSSGSEAEPKMVAYTHRAMGGGRAAYLRALDPGSTERRHLLLVSLASSFGSAGILTLAALGGTLLVQPHFSAPDALTLLTRHRPTHVLGVPTMLRRLAEQPAAPDEDLASLRSLVSSGAALPEGTAALCRDRFGRPVVTVYGSSDGVNCHTVHGSEPAGCTGVPDPSVVGIRVTGPDGRPLPPGRSGEIQAKGPMTPLCYVAAPGLDARYRTADGWVRTGDLGRLDERGRLFVLGRLRNVVVRGGLNISPAEVEHELGTHPEIAEAVCVPVPDPELGERLCACVRQAPGTGPLSLPDLTGYLTGRRGLEKRKLPEFLLRVPQMPLGPTGKICRRTLTEQATDELRAGAYASGAGVG